MQQQGTVWSCPYCAEVGRNLQSVVRHGMRAQLKTNGCHLLGERHEAGEMMRACPIGVQSALVL